MGWMASCAASGDTGLTATHAQALDGELCCTGALGLMLMLPLINPSPRLSWAGRFFDGPGMPTTTSIDQHRQPSSLPSRHGNVGVGNFVPLAGRWCATPCCSLATHVFSLRSRRQTAFHSWLTCMEREITLLDSQTPGRHEQQVASSHTSSPATNIQRCK